MNINNEFKQQTKKSVPFWPVQRQVLAKLFNVPEAQVVEGTVKQDRDEVIDAVIAGKWFVALRIREHDVYHGSDRTGDWKHQVTIRANTGRSEAAKVNSGLGQFNLYGFKSEDGQSFHAWSLGSLAAVHDIAKLIDAGLAYPTDYGVFSKEPTGQNTFVGFDVREMGNYLLASTEPAHIVGNVQRWEPDGEPYRPWITGGAK